ncbi:hypothetical protein DRO97_02895 [Archaeoglobales archaeon]|nr:MAG: hypothetical protein DRO97_02895 [Archaeoglobales archaeon]
MLYFFYLFFVILTVPIKQTPNFKILNCSFSKRIYRPTQIRVVKLKTVLMLALVFTLTIQVANAELGNLTIKIEDNKKVNVSVWGNNTFVNQTGNSLNFVLPLNTTYHMLIQHGSLSLLKRIYLSNDTILNISLNTTNNVRHINGKIHTIIYPTSYLEVYEILILQNNAKKIFFGSIKLPLPRHSNFEMVRSTASFEKYKTESNHLLIENITIFPNSSEEIMFSYIVNSDNFSRNVDFLSEALILVKGTSKVTDKSPFITSNGIQQFNGEIFEVLSANLTGKDLYYVLISQDKQPISKANTAIVLGILLVSVGLVLLLLDKGKEWEINNK